MVCCRVCCFFASRFTVFENVLPVQSNRNTLFANLCPEVIIIDNFYLLSFFKPGCPRNMIFFEGSCKALVNSARTFATAQEYRNSVFGGAYLVQIESVVENDAVARLQKNADLWIGLRKVDPSLPGKQGWAWTHSNVKYPNGYTNNWTSGEPNSKGGRGKKQCAMIWGWRKVLTWDDLGCDSKMWSVCEKGELSYCREREPERERERERERKKERDLCVVLVSNWSSW